MQLWVRHFSLKTQTECISCKRIPENLVIFCKNTVIEINYYIFTAATFRLFGSSSVATVGESFELTCITTAQYLTWNSGVSTQAVITGIHHNGSCLFAGSYIRDFIYNCNPSTYTYKLRLPGKLVTQDRNGIYWKCQDPFGGGSSDEFQLNLICKFTSI